MTNTTYIAPRSLSPAQAATARQRACSDQATRVTRSLAGYGILAGPCYVVLSLSQAVTREGFDLSRHAWSQLALGDWGWLQVANLVGTGVMASAFAVALRRTLRGGRGGRAVPALVATFGVGLLLAGIFTTDPMGGFPVGMSTPATPSVHGILHLATSGIGFVALAAAMVVMARRYASEQRRGRAVFSVVAAVALLGGFATIASGSPLGVIALTVGILTAFAWMTGLGIDTFSRATYALAGPARG
jgi:hypothetical membrane protein